MRYYKVKKTALWLWTESGWQCSEQDEASASEPIQNAVRRTRKEEKMKEKIKEIRTNLNLTQKAFADKIGVSSASVKNYESGKCKPKEDVLDKICELGGISKDWLAEKAGDAAVAAVGVLEKAGEAKDKIEEAAVTTEIEVKKATRATARKAKETVEAAVTSDEAVAAEIEVKKAARATARKVKETADMVKEAVASAAKKPALFIQAQAGGTITPDEILSRIPENCDSVYVKPDENKAYWVKGEESGSVDLW